MLKSKYTAEDIEIRIWGFVVVCITIILFGIVFVLLYSLIFVVQPIKSMAPLDMQFSKILNDIVLLLVGGIGGIVGKRAVGAVSQAVTPTPPPTPTHAPAPAAPAPTTPPVPAAPVQNTFGALPVWTNPPLDESWSPPPPPTTPPSLEDDAERELQAEARASVK
jgi:hypothetical protein